MRFESQFFSHELPDVFCGVQFGTFGGHWDEHDVGGGIEPARKMPSGLIHEDGGVCVRRDLRGDLARCRLIASVSQRGITRAAPMPRPIVPERW